MQRSFRFASTPTRIHSRAWQPTSPAAFARPSVPFRSLSSNASPQPSQRKDNDEDREDATDPLSISAYLQRCFARRHDIQRYEDAQVFHPSSSRLRNLLTFLILQMPSRSAVDLVDFHRGAQHACTVLLEAANSEDMQQHVAQMQQKHSDPEMTQRELVAVENLQAWCTPGCYAELVDGVRSISERHMRVHARHVEVTECHVTHVNFDRVTADHWQELQQTMAMRVGPRQWAEDADIELLQVTVMFQTREELEMTLVGKESSVVCQENEYECRLDSRVTSPHQIEWQVASLARNKTISSKLLSRTVWETPEPLTQEPTTTAVQEENETMEPDGTEPTRASERSEKAD